MDTGPEAHAAAKDAPLTGTLKSWWELGLSVGTTLVAVLASTGLGEVGQAVALSVAVIAFAATVFLWRRRRNRKVVLNDRIQAYRHWKERVSDSAFRGLYAFGRSDVLPGVERRRSAVALATWVKSERFRFGVISGDVGCGKTSFVNAVASLLEESGYQVLVCEGLHGLVQAEPAGGAGPGVAQVLSTLRQDSVAKAGGNPFVLIIDQFEEFLIRYVLPAERQQFGHFLDEPIADAESRVVCAVRSDYLLEMHDLAPALPEPLSTKSLFRLRNFSIEEAEEIILECAERDGVPISNEFATLIAHDLSHGSLVRPAELQIVCSALSGKPSLEGYKETTGSAAILSDYIKTAIEISVDPRLARIVLRAFCDFDALPPAKAKPQTQAEIAEALGLDLTGQPKLGQILESLEASRLITSLPQSNLETLLYTLVHDYLVSSIAGATGDLRTPTEAADQELRGFIFQYQNDRKTRIPLRKVSRLKRLASSGLIRSRDAQILFRKSTVSHATQISFALALIIFALMLARLFTGIQPRWEKVLIGRYYPADSLNGRNLTSFVSSPDGRHIWSGPNGYTGGVPWLRVWESRTGRLLLSDSAKDLFISPNGDLFLFEPLHRSTMKLVGVSSRKTVDVPFRINRDPYYTLEQLDFLSDKIIAYFPNPRDNIDTMTIHLWSIPEHRQIGALSSVDFHGVNTFFPPLYLSGHGDRLLLFADHDTRRVPFIWRISQHGDIRDLHPLLSSGDANVYDSGLNSRGTLLATLEVHGGNELDLCLWDLQTERRILCRDFSFHLSDVPRTTPLQFEFSDDDRFLLIYGNYYGYKSFIGMYDTDDLMPNDLSPPRDASMSQSDSQSDSGVVVFWRTGRNTGLFWRVSDHTITPLQGLSPQTVRVAIFSRDGGFLLVQRKEGDVELWDFSKRRMIRALHPPGKVVDANFTLDRRTIAVYSEGGLYTFYDARSGEKIASPSSIDKPSLIYRDEGCQRFHVWTTEGLVFRYIRGRSIPFRGFRPTEDKPECH